MVRVCHGGVGNRGLWCIRAYRCLVCYGRYSPARGAGLDRFRITIGSPDLIEHLPFRSYDENYHRIFEDPATRAAADGIAFHPYWGDPAVMREAYEEFGKPVHMTETSDLIQVLCETGGFNLDYLRLTEL